MDELPEYLGPVEERPADPGGASLELVHEPTGPRHHLAGVPLHPGAAVELLVAGRRWVRGAYQWSFDVSEPPTLTIEEPWGPHTAPLDPEAILRWPS